MLRPPTLSGVIARRLLVNFTVDADVAAAFVPESFEPRLVGGRAVAGVCLIRLTQLKPRLLPGSIGLRSENAAHRIAVIRRDGNAQHPGVYIPRRDSGSLLTTLVGGRAFPGEHHRADFVTAAAGNRFEVGVRSRDGAVDVDVAGHVGEELPADSVFESVAQASQFFAQGSVGWSATSVEGCYDTLELRTDQWSVDAFDVDRAHSSFFENRNVFPPDSVRFDHALIMRDIKHTWHLAATTKPATPRR